MMDGYLNQGVIDEIDSLLDDPQRRAAAAEHNFQIAKRYFSFEYAKQKIRSLLSDQLDGAERLQPLC
jgi:hypothetical protein